MAAELAEVEAAAAELQAAEADLAKARDRLQVALEAAHAVGASYGLLGRLVGLSRQRVAEIVIETHRRGFEKK